MLYNIILALHNLVRWAVVILGLIALARAYSGWLGNRQWIDADRKAGVFFASAMDTQFLLGLILYLISPLTRLVLAGNFSAAFADPTTRFFGYEHIGFMLVAVVLVHIGSALSRKAPSSQGRHRLAAMWYTLAAVIIALSIPWWRPLLPGLGGF